MRERKGDDRVGGEVNGSRFARLHCVMSDYLMLLISTSQH